MSTPKRFFVPPIAYPDQTEVVLDGDEFVHAKSVLRVDVGTEICLLDNSGNEYEAIVSKIEKRSLTAHITGVNVGDKEPNVRVTLLIGALKGDKTELVVQKATELGITNIIVFGSQYCSAYVNDNKIERFNRVAHEAAKQCLRQIAPTVTYCDTLAKAIEQAGDAQNKLFACEFATQTDADIAHLSGDTVLVVGSEGGFAEEEFTYAQSQGYAGVTLGKRILRAETAAVALTAVVMFSLGELQ